MSTERSDVGDYQVVASPLSGGTDVPPGWTEAESKALHAIVDALPEGTARFRSVEATGMGRNDYHHAADLAIRAFRAMRSLPVEERMEAMGMEPDGHLRHDGVWGYLTINGTFVPTWSQR